MATGQGAEQARRRFGDRARTLDPIPPLADRGFILEDLFEDGGRGLAHAAARAGNESARQALADLARLERDINSQLPDDYTPPDLAGGDHPWGAQDHPWSFMDA